MNMASQMELPVDIHAASAPSLVFLVVAALFFVASLWWAYRERSRTGMWTAMLALAGGAIASLEEPWVNASIMLWYPRDAPAVLFTALDHPQPLYLHLIYPGFVGLGAYVVYRGLVSHPDGKLLIRTWWGIVLLDLAFEIPATSLNIFRYYGPQPLQFADGTLPLWVPFINATGPLVGGVLIYVLHSRLSGKRRALLILAPPLGYAGVYGAVGWPAYTALNSDVPQFAREVAAIITVALCVSIVVALRWSLGSSARQILTCPTPTTQGVQ